MSDSTKAHIEQMVQTIFQNRREQEHRVLNEQVAAHLNDHSSRGVIQSGMFRSGVGRLYGQFLIRVIDQSLEQLELTQRQAGRKDATFFWNVVDEKLKQLSESIKASLSATAISYCKQRGGLSASDEAVVLGGFSQYAGQTQGHIHSRVGELRLRSEFITLKSPTDRKANQIPDVAVMMWFPDPNKPVQAHAAETAKQKYQAICDAVNEASNGLATINKIDDPNLVHRDRISPAVEQWLAKSVLVICDLEGNRPNVFYEFGFARASGTDVIATCPEGQRADFHLSQWNTDFYRDLDELKNKITPRIATVLRNYDLSGST